MNKTSREMAIAHAQAAYPNEACGLFVRIENCTGYWPCRNVAESGEHFVMSPEDYADADEAGEIIGVFHSHPDAPAEPSEQDLISAQASGLPWYILSVPDLKWGYAEPKGFTPELVGRSFVYGKTDCFTLIRDYYRTEHNLILNSYDSEDKWWESGKNLYVENFANEGFKEVPLSDLQPGDAIFMKLMAPVSNHAAVYLGYNTILHHLYGRLSCREPYSDFWRKISTHALRYSDEKN